MSQEVKPNPEESAALDQIAATVGGAQAVAGADALHFDLGDLCKKYQAIKASLEILLKFIKKIPVYGAKIAAAIEFLMSLADIACPV
jgi:uncharacterized protein (DUF1684 family)